MKAAVTNEQHGFDIVDLVRATGVHGRVLVTALRP
jgi:hypothetical protein